MIPLGLRIGVRHLTVVPLPFVAAEDSAARARALPWFPVIGALIGACVTAVLLLPIDPVPRAALALVVWVLLTGNLHEDGVADVADALFAPADVTRRLQILRDPHVGAHGVSALVLLLVLRFALLTVVPVFAPVAAAAAGRFVMAWAIARHQPMSGSRLAVQFREGSWWLPPLLAFVVVAGVLGVAAGPVAGTGAAAAAIVGTALAAQLARTFHGVNGDICGAAGVVTETCALAVVCIHA